jgi:hypothetical protein
VEDITKQQIALAIAENTLESKNYATITAIETNVYVDDDQIRDLAADIKWNYQVPRKGLRLLFGGVNNQPSRPQEQWEVDFYKRYIREFGIANKQDKENFSAQNGLAGNWDTQVVTILAKEENIDIETFEAIRKYVNNEVLTKKENISLLNVLTKNASHGQIEAGNYTKANSTSYTGPYISVIDLSNPSDGRVSNIISQEVLDSLVWRPYEGALFTQGSNTQAEPGPALVYKLENDSNNVYTVIPYDGSTPYRIAEKYKREFVPEQNRYRVKTTELIYASIPSSKINRIDVPSKTIKYSDKGHISSVYEAFINIIRTTEYSTENNITKIALQENYERIKGADITPVTVNIFIDDNGFMWKAEGTNNANQQYRVYFDPITGLALNRAEAVAHKMDAPIGSLPSTSMVIWPESRPESFLDSENTLPLRIIDPPAPKTHLEDIENVRRRFSQIPGIVHPLPRKEYSDQDIPEVYDGGYIHQHFTANSVNYTIQFSPKLNAISTMPYSQTQIDMEENGEITATNNIGRREVIDIQETLEEFTGFKLPVQDKNQVALDRLNRDITQNIENGNYFAAEVTIKYGDIESAEPTEIIVFYGGEDYVLKKKPSPDTSTPLNRAIQNTPPPDTENIQALFDPGNSRELNKTIVSIEHETLPDPLSELKQMPQEYREHFNSPPTGGFEEASWSDDTYIYRAFRKGDSWTTVQFNQSGEKWTITSQLSPDNVKGLKGDEYGDFYEIGAEEWLKNFEIKTLATATMKPNDPDDVLYNLSSFPMDRQIQVDAYITTQLLENGDYPLVTYEYDMSEADQGQIFLTVTVEGGGRKQVFNFNRPGGDALLDPDMPYTPPEPTELLPEDPFEGEIINEREWGDLFADIFTAEETEQLLQEEDLTLEQERLIIRYVETGVINSAEETILRNILYPPQETEALPPSPEFALLIILFLLYNLLLP